MVKAEAAPGARATTGLTPLFSRFCPQLISASRFCDRILANSMIPMIEGEEDTYSNRNIPKLAHLYQCPESVPRFDFSQELFRAQIHSFARIERALLSAAFNLDFIDCGSQPELAFPFPVPVA